MNIKPIAIGAALTALLPAILAFAQTGEGVRAGKWEYTVTMQMPGVPQLPPSIKLPPGVSLQQGAGGMTTKHTTCVAGGDPTAELRKPHGASQCKIDRMDRNGGNVAWSMTCATQNGTLHSEGTGHYTSESMEVNVKSRTMTHQGVPIEVSNHVVGRYLGPCDSP